MIVSIKNGAKVFNQLPVDDLIKAHEEWPQIADIGWWKSACAALSEYEPPVATLKLAHAERKWELVSAYQKTVRRGDTELALKLVSAMCSLPEELPYFWKRVTTTACEDIGAGDVATMNFVIMTTKVFTPKKAGDMQYKIMCFLTEMMCATTKSRAFCRMDVLRIYTEKKILPSNMGEDEKILLSNVSKANLLTKEAWPVKNTWRGENMLHYQLFDGDLDLFPVTTVLPETRLIKGLPEYCYDMYTRAGGKVLAMLTGFKVVKDFFEQSPVFGSEKDALGHALFYEESQLEKDGFESPTLSILEQKFTAAVFGLTAERWMELRNLISHLLVDDAIYKLRVKVLDQAGY